MEKKTEVPAQLRGTLVVRVCCGAGVASPRYQEDADAEDALEVLLSLTRVAPLPMRLRR